MDFKKFKEWAETASVFHGLFVLVGGAVSVRLTSLTGAPLWGVILGCLLGMILLLLLLIFYKRNDPEKAWVYKTFLVIIAVGALSAIDTKVSGWLSNSLFSPERQVRKWIDEIDTYKSKPADPPPGGHVFHYDITTTTGQSFSIWQDPKEGETLVIVSRVHLEDCFKIIPEKERERRWLEIGLVLLRYDIKISPDARFGPVVVSNWIPFGPATTKQQFIAELRRFHHVIEMMNILCLESSLMKDPKL